MNASLNEKYFERKLYRKSKHTFYGQRFLLMKILPFLDKVKEHGSASQATHNNQTLPRKCKLCSRKTKARYTHLLHLIINSSKLIN
jgi:hypothetical protein